MFGKIAGGRLMATEEPGRVTLSGGEYASEWVPGADGRLVYCPALSGPTWSCSCGARGYGSPTTQAAHAALQEHFRSQRCRPDTRAPRRTRMRKTASPPTLTGLRQAYLGARSGQAAFDTLLAFLAAVAAVESEDELDILDDDSPARADPACQVGALVCVVLVLASWYGLITAYLTGELVVAAVVGVPAAVAAWVLGRVVTARRHRDG
jgi:hypothetical protein